LSVQATEALDALIDVFAAPPEDATRRISAALSGVLAHRAAAVLAGACARSPMTVHGEPGLAARITSADLARLAATVPVGQAWHGAALVAGEERPLLAVAAGAGSLLVLVLADGAEPDAETIGLVQRLWTVAAERMGHAIEEAEPTALAASRQAESERARVTAELTEAHAAALAALLGTLRARDLDDRAARRAATDLAASALVELRSAARRERELTDEPAEQAFALLRDELRPLVRYSSAELEFVPPAAADGALPGTIAQAARAIVRGAVVTMLEQQQADVRRIRVAWEHDRDELRVSVRDDGPGRLAEQGLALHALTDRARAVDGELRVESVPGWGSHVQARLPLEPVRDTAVPAGPLAALNPRELEVLAQLVRGRRNRQIAATLGISENTVKFHVANVLAKLGAASRGEAAAIARDAGLSAPLHAVA
jgi:DNA-binding CsgD family transcriptional regulator